MNHADGGGIQGEVVEVTTFTTGGELRDYVFLSAIKSGFISTAVYQETSWCLCHPDCWGQVGILTVVFSCFGQESGN